MQFCDSMGRRIRISARQHRVGIGQIVFQRSYLSDVSVFGCKYECAHFYLTKAADRHILKI